MARKVVDFCVRYVLLRSLKIEIAACWTCPRSGLTLAYQHSKSSISFSTWRVPGLEQAFRITEIGFACHENQFRLSWRIDKMCRSSTACFSLSQLYHQQPLVGMPRSSQEPSIKHLILTAVMQVTNVTRYDDINAAALANCTVRTVLKELLVLCYFPCLDATEQLRVRNLCEYIEFVTNAGAR